MNFAGMNLGPIGCTFEMDQNVGTVFAETVFLPHFDVVLFIFWVALCRVLQICAPYVDLSIRSYF